MGTEFEGVVGGEHKNEQDRAFGVQNPKTKLLGLGFGLGYANGEGSRREGPWQGRVWWDTCDSMVSGR